MLSIHFPPSTWSLGSAPAPTKARNKQTHQRLTRRKYRAVSSVRYRKQCTAIRGNSILRRILKSTLYFRSGLLFGAFTRVLRSNEIQQLRVSSSRPSLAVPCDYLLTFLFAIRRAHADNSIERERRIEPK